MVTQPMTETTYHENKIYLPKKIRENLQIVEGDVLHIEVIEKGTAKLSVIRRSNATKRALEKLDTPPDMGTIKGKLSRDEIYEDIT
jgi:bifunctional DNA-binding transcriptional regulator/antitoxin component of YhaV-PrlF toxin-antitoxin module